MSNLVPDALAPITVRQRVGTANQDEFRGQAVLAWYQWVREFFCDAVNLTISGPCFLNTFFQTVISDRDRFKN